MVHPYTVHSNKIQVKLTSFPAHSVIKENGKQTSNAVIEGGSI